MAKVNSNDFSEAANLALNDPALQTALGRAQSGFVDKRAKSISLVDNFEAMKLKAQTAKKYALSRLPELLEQFEANVCASGGQVHWAAKGQQLNQIVLDICRTQNAAKVLKGKSMISEETGLNAFLESAGLELVETDLGEYILQLAQERPSHIIAPAVHKTRQQVKALFQQHHNNKSGTSGDDTDSIADLVSEARAVLREQFLSADVGITGANLLIAESGSVVLVTNEGNGDLSATLPPVHIVTASLEKIVATLDDACSVLEVLARSATGQATSTYTSFFNGIRRPQDLDGPKLFHVVLLDNGRSDLIGTDYQDILRCIKCGACLNHCPVYTNVGGHAYGSVYPGPMGSVLTPLLNGLDQAIPLPNASSFCGRCEEVCPMSIPLPKLLRQLRADQYDQHLEPKTWRFGLSLYSWVSTKPGLFHLVLGLALKSLRLWQWLGLSRAEALHPIPATINHNQTFMSLWHGQKTGEIDHD